MAATTVTPMMFTCRIGPTCTKAFPTPQGRHGHEMSHRPTPLASCPECGLTMSKHRLAVHQRSKHDARTGRREIKKKNPERKPVTRRSLGSILEELYDAIARFEAEYEAMAKRLDAYTEQMDTVKRAMDAATAPRTPKPPRR